MGPEEPYDGLKPIISRGSGGLLPRKIFENQCWKTHPGILGLETLTSGG